jgi:ABC-2 type transport system ATP-binding protein
MTSAAVLARGLTKRFGDVVAVDALDLEVPAHGVVALLGPNGAGKTTAVRMIATLELPSAGSLEVCGFDAMTQGEQVRRRVSLTGQFAALEDNLTAVENLLLIARLRGHRKRAAKALVDELVERFDIGEFRDKLVKSISGGQRRRVDLAASLVVQPELLVLDEPTTGLDPRSRQTVWSTVRDLVAEGVTVVLTTQYLEEADALADRIVLIDHGREIATGTPSQLKSRIGEQRVDVVAVDSASLDHLVAELGCGFALDVAREQRTISIPAPDEAADLARIATAVQATGIPVDEVALRRPTLDDAFLALTGGMPVPTGAAGTDGAAAADPADPADRAAGGDADLDASPDGQAKTPVTTGARS